MPLVAPNTGHSADYFYPQARESLMHPLVRAFFSLSSSQIAQRYAELNPPVRPEAVHALLNTRQAHFHWAGADLFPAQQPTGARRMVVLEINSCPSGQKALPLGGDDGPYRHYRRLIERSFLPLLANPALPAGPVAVLYDKNAMEAAGYAATLADALGEAVHLLQWDHAGQAALRFRHGRLELADGSGGWQPIRAVFRYLTQRPWRHIPGAARTAFFNPIAACLAGGRNKLLAAAAYRAWNAASELQIFTPQTLGPLVPSQIAPAVAAFGGMAVVKVPYGNAGQGVYTITSRHDLAACLAQLAPDAQCIVQELIGHPAWATGPASRLAYAATNADGQRRRYVMDLRMMLGNGPAGFYPVALYGRRARLPLTATPPARCSWATLGTNLSVRRRDGSWQLETERLLVPDTQHFPMLGLGLDDLIASYIQTVLAARAVDQMAARLLAADGSLDLQRLLELNPDPALIDEVWRDRSVAALC